MNADRWPYLPLIIRVEDAVAQVDEGVQHDFSAIDSGPTYVEYRRQEIRAKLVSERI